jgi:hypothetical protein
MLFEFWSGVQQLANRLIDSFKKLSIARRASGQFVPRPNND